ncbi:kinase APK1A, chloroplastic-like isoform X1 [Olea europaea subsp. europaea]|uniref:Kinase APK1A, chloroplastic-like isoform X1 n=1 Tax=Olea europaea subsp. europaea TaxID=158383 RepID=A0A8S0UVV8_OLEEU|nr:kinase APK1A, chloroplastic-like isoform X1 [Olea europaea subsp. europaea]
MGICLSAKVKVESNPAGTGENSKVERTNGSDLSNSSSKVLSVSVPPTPRTEGEILQASNLKSFNFADRKMATRNFRPDSVLGEGGYGPVFKGWIDENSFAAAKAGTGMVIELKSFTRKVFRANGSGWQR